MDQLADINKEFPDRAYEMQASLVHNVLMFIEVQNKEGMIKFLKDYHPADIADLFEQIKPTQRSALVELWGKEMDGEVFAEMDEGLSGDLLEKMPDDVVSEVLRDLETDDVVDLVEDLEKNIKDYKKLLVSTYLKEMR